MKKYLWKDKTGRGITNTFEGDDELKEAFTPDEVDDNGETIEEWLDTLPSVGDEWESRTQQVTRIE